jgi:hypothetical protein
MQNVYDILFKCHLGFLLVESAREWDGAILKDLVGRCPMCRGSLTQDLVGPLVSDTRQEQEEDID